MANLKNITELPVAESADGLNLIVNDNGAAKQIAVNAINTQTDWNQNDPSALNYVKNRPFWTDDPKETVLVEEQIITIGEDLYAQCNANLYYVVGETYTVNFNGTIYECIAYEILEENVVCIGNGSIVGITGGNGEPFFSYSDVDNETFIQVAEAGDYVVSISAKIAENHKIDKKYLPDELAAMVGYDGIIPLISALSICFEGKIIPFGSNETQTAEVSEEQWIKAYQLAIAAGNNLIACEYQGSMINCYVDGDNIRLIKDECFLADISNNIVVARLQCTMSYDKDAQLVTAKCSGTERVIE